MHLYLPTNKSSATERRGVCFPGVNTFFMDQYFLESIYLRRCSTPAQPEKGSRQLATANKKVS